MTDHQFKTMVRAMRVHQREFSKTQRVQELNYSRDYERRVDDYLQQYFNPVLSL